MSFLTNIVFAFPDWYFEHPRDVANVANIPVVAPSDCMPALEFNITSAEIDHRGEPVWVFTSDYQTSNGLPCRFQMDRGTNSRVDYKVADADAVYFEKGAFIYMDGWMVSLSTGPGVVKIPDTYEVETIYGDGYLAVFFETGLLYELGIADVPHRVAADDIMSSIWTLDRPQFCRRS